EIHGGPFADYGDRFDLEKQLMAASGYVVLYTNPRGSTSYGAEFGNLIHHAYPGDDFFDLNSGVDAMVAKSYIDPEQLYVTGGSGGGVLTCWMIGRTPRFRAAVTVYPVINWYSFVLTCAIGNWTGNHWFPGYPWDNVEHYEKRNLLSVVKNVKSPTMVLTGEADYRTPMSDSEQYYQALKLLGVESVLVRMPDEPHGIQVRPSHHMSKILHIIGWVDKPRKSDVAVRGEWTPERLLQLSFEICHLSLVRKSPIFIDQGGTYASEKLRVSIVFRICCYDLRLRAAQDWSAPAASSGQGLGEAAQRLEFRRMFRCGD